MIPDKVIFVLAITVFVLHLYRCLRPSVDPESLDFFAADE